MTRMAAGLSIALLAGCSGGSGSGPGGPSHDGGALDGAASAPDTSHVSDVSLAASEAGSAQDVPATGTDTAARHDTGASDAASCTATAVPSTIIANYLGSSLSVVGQDVYYILATDNAGQGAIHHVVIDGTGDAIVVNPAAGAVLLAATAFGDDLFYFQVDDAAGVSPAEHLYRASRLVGGPGVQVGTGTFPGFGIGVVGGGVAGIQALRTRGVFAASGTDIFVNDGSEISRVSLADGTKTVITAPASSGIQFPNLLGATIYYRDLTGNLYSVPAAATTASSAPLGNQTCGQVDTYWMASYPGGFLCSGIYLLYQIDLTGTQKTTILNTLTDKTPIQWNPTSVDGTTYYAVPMGTANSTDPIYRMDTTTGASGVAVTCAVHSVYDYRLTATDLVFIELLGSASGGTMSLRRLPR